MHKAKAFLTLILETFFLYINLLLVVLFYKKSFNLPFLIEHYLAFTPLFFIWILVFYIEGLYSLRTHRHEGLLISLAKTHGINIIISYIYFYLVPTFTITPKTNILLLAGLNFLSFYVIRKSLYSLFSKETFSENVVLFGDAQVLSEIKSTIREKPFLGYNLLKHSKKPDANLLQEANVVVFEKSFLKDQNFTKSMIDQFRDDLRFMDISLFSEIVTGKVPVSSIENAWFLENFGQKTRRINRLIKNLFDKILAIILLLPTLLLGLFIIPFLYFTSGRPIFFFQTRTGLGNQPFKIIKLRTMKVDAEKGKAKWATPNDSRVTRLGKILRKTRLDELPQLLNILKGEMSFVGPRPERPEIIEQRLQPQIPFYAYRHLVKPGVTGWAQINYRYGYSEEDALIKLQYDLFYVKNQNFWLDLKIVLKTLKTVVSGLGH